jgi:hypothetical protein
MHTVLPQTLLDRLLIHHQVGEIATPDLDSRSEIGPDEMQSINHMFYTSAVVAVYQLMQVRIREGTYQRCPCLTVLLAVPGRTSCYYPPTLRGGSFPWFREMDAPTQVAAGNFANCLLTNGHRCCQ